MEQFYKRAILLLLVTGLFIVNGRTQTTLAAGDIAILGVNLTGGPQFAFVTLRGMSAGTVINFTDRGWTGSAFDNLTSDGTISWTTSAAVSVGTVVRVVFSANGANPTVSGFPNGSVSISGWTTTVSATNGDQMIVYQGPDVSPTFIYGFSNSTSNGSPSTTLDWQTGSITTNRDSQLPTGLTNSTNSNAATAIAFSGTSSIDNNVYDAKTNGFSGSQAQLLTLIGNRGNWVQSNTVAEDLSVNGTFLPTSFVIGVLPLDLLSFTCVSTPHSNLLSWATTNEINVADFEIQRAADSSTFISIGRLDAVAKSPSLRETYQFTDDGAGNGALPARCFYRLKMNDRDGKYKFSKTVSALNTGIESPAYTLYPNPVTGSTLYVKSQSILSAAVNARIVDAVGRIWYVKELQASALNSGAASITISSLPAGVYFLEIRDKTGGSPCIIPFEK